MRLLPSSKLPFRWLLVAACLLLCSLTGHAQTLSGTYNSASYIPVTSGSYTATGITLNLKLNYAPVAGTTLTVVDNTGPASISGTFKNLAQGQLLAMSYSGTTYNFVANYYGGTGNDLVLVWAGDQPFAWGDNSLGQLGDGGTAESLGPVAVTSSSSSPLHGQTVFSVAAGSYHSLALCSDGAVAAWGDNAYGELGTGGTTGSLVPVAVSGSASSALYHKTVVSISAGSDHNLALCSDGSVAAWGYGADGELGNGGKNSSLLPAAVTSASGSTLLGGTVSAISAGGFHSLALLSSGAVAAWGYNIFGQLGDSGTADSLIPVAVTTSSGTALYGKTVVAISAGSDHSLALCSDGAIAAWGDNYFGQLGNSGSGTANSLVPVLVNSSSGSALFGKTVVAIAAGGFHSLALCSDGTVAAWGYNVVGQLGNDSTASSSIPVTVITTTGALSGKRVTAISAGLFDSYAYCSDGTAVAWGWNSYGQLGQGSLTKSRSSIPLAISTSNLATGDAFAGVSSGPAAYHALSLVGPPRPAQAPAIRASLSYH